MTSVEIDGLAWQWLERIERLDWHSVSRQKADGQIAVRLCPHADIRRDDGSKVASIVSVLVHHPRLSKPVKGSGNTLMGAVREVWRLLHQNGVELPPPGMPNVTVAEWVALGHTSTNEYA